jgi:hypothetical protein
VENGKSLTAMIAETKIAKTNAEIAKNFLLFFALSAAFLRVLCG